MPFPHAANYYVSGQKLSIPVFECMETKDLKDGTAKNAARYLFWIPDGIDIASQDTIIYLAPIPIRKMMIPRAKPITSANTKSINVTSMPFP